MFYFFEAKVFEPFDGEWLDAVDEVSFDARSVSVSDSFLHEMPCRLSSCAIDRRTYSAIGTPVLLLSFLRPALCVLLMKNMVRFLAFGSCEQAVISVLCPHLESIKKPPAMECDMTGGYQLECSA